MELPFRSLTPRPQQMEALFLAKTDELMCMFCALKGYQKLTRQGLLLSALPL